MKRKLINILETFCPNNVYLQGSINPADGYPSKFITFFITDSDFDSFYDNDANRIEWYVSVMFYSSDPSEVQTIPPQIVKALRKNGFIPTSAGIDVISNVQTHTGWAMDFIYPELYSN